MRSGSRPTKRRPPMAATKPSSPYLRHCCRRFGGCSQRTRAPSRVTAPEAVRVGILQNGRLEPQHCFLDIVIAIPRLIRQRKELLMPPTTATVNAANAYRQIITNFSNPLEFVREAISNSIDAKATKMTVLIEQVAGPTGQPEIR